MAVWAATVVFLVITLRFHPAADVNVELSASQIALPMSPSSPFDVDTWKEFHCNRVEKVSAEGTPFRARDEDTQREYDVQSLDSDYGSCTFRGARVSDLQLQEPAVVTFFSTSDGSYTVSAGRSRVTAVIEVPAGKPSECTGVRVDDKSIGLLRIQSTGDLSLRLRSASGARIRFARSHTPGKQRGELLSALPLSGQLTVAKEDLVRTGGKLGRSQRGAVIDSPADTVNNVVFAGIATPLNLHKDDIVEIQPVPGQCSIRSLQFGDGFRMSLQGRIADIRTGAGPRTVASRMPNLFEHLDARSRFFAFLPALAGALITILEKAGVLKK